MSDTPILTPPPEVPFTELEQLGALVGATVGATVNGNTPAKAVASVVGLTLAFIRLAIINGEHAGAIMAGVCVMHEELFERVVLDMSTEDAERYGIDTLRDMLAELQAGR